MHEGAAVLIKSGPQTYRVKVSEILYLEKNGNIMDNELLTNNTDVSEMPSQVDYLTDENTLNTYLDKIDAETSDKSNP